MKKIILSTAFLVCAVFINLNSYADASANSLVDPDSIDPEIEQVMYIIEPTDLKVHQYSNGIPSSFNVKLCNVCQTKTYAFAKDSSLLLNEISLEIDDLAISLIKKNFNKIQLGIDRSNGTISYLYLGGINELTPPMQEL